MSFEYLLSELIVPILKMNFYLLALIGSILSTNLFVLFLASLAGQGTFELWKVWLIAIAGILISDIIWFNLGKTNLIQNIARHRYLIYNFNSIKYLLDKSEEKNYFLVFLTSKFVYGLKILTLMRAGRRNMHMEDFVKYNFPSSIIWSTIIVLLGFLTGKGFVILVEAFNSIKYALIILGIIIVSIYTIWFISGRIIMYSWREINKKMGSKMIVPKMRYHKIKNRFS